MENQDVKITPQSETQNTVFCAHCGAQAAADTAVCMSCGCPVKAAPAQPVSQPTAARHGAPAKKSPLMWILLGIGTVILVAAVLVVALLVVPEMRKAEICEQLAGETFTYYKWGSYSYSWEELEFLDEERVKYSYYFSSIDAGSEYTWDYTIEFDGDDVYVIRSSSKYRIEFDGDEIESLYDTEYKERYEKE